MGKTAQGATAAYQVRLSENASRNIDEITGYIAFVNHEPLNAIKVADAIFDMIDLIGRNPYAYKECVQIPTKAKMYRQALCLSWHIIYKIALNEILILGVIHASRKSSLRKELRRIK